MKSSAPVYTHREVVAERGICAAGHPLAAEAAIRVMRAGGNAIDALAAASFVSFVVEPASCGIGGYTHISVYLGKRDEFVTFDAYGRAPAAAHPRMFTPDASRAPTYFGHPHVEGNAAESGFLAAAVPGAVAGTCDMHEAFGRLGLAAVLAPAIEVAEAGIDWTWHGLLQIAPLVEAIERLPDSAAVMLPGGRLPKVPYQSQPDRMDSSALARTLRRVASAGKRGFYRGRTAQAIARYMAANGGLIGTDDLAGYRTRVLRERPSRYRDQSYTSCFDPVAYEALNILEGYDLRARGPDSYEYRHLTAEALGVAFADNMTHYGDPDFAAAPVNGLSSPAYAAARRKELRMRRALERPIRAGDPWPHEDAWTAPEQVAAKPTSARRNGTSQAATADAEGNVASCCMSLGGTFGSLVYVPEVGIFLNNAMQNFDPRPDLPNSIAPGKMPIFAAPAIVARAGNARFAASGAGGYRIETGVLHTFMNVVDHRMPPQAAVDHPRVHCQGDETVVDARIPEAVRRRLERAGHRLVVVDDDPGTLHFGRVCAVTRDGRGGALRAGAGPAWRTAIAGF